MRMLRVIEPGMLTLIQDLGRPGLGAIGVARGGAADSLSLRIGNRLVGNPDDAPAIEMTMLGGSFAFQDDAAIVLTGGRTAAVIIGKDHQREIAMSCPITVHAGERLTTGPIVRGVRTYLCIAGGIAVPRVLGSASTHLGAAFGGFHGRALRRGDEIPIGEIPAGITPTCTAGAAEMIERMLSSSVLRAVDGSHASEFSASLREDFWSRTFTVSARCDRVGIRLVGRIGNESPHHHGVGAMSSEGMMCGAVQIPPGGEPIILMVDHPTTGGYPVIACVATVDVPALGQLRPGASVSFERATLPASRELFRQQERELNAQAPFP
ncbi:MAG: biotin-dependent carboxyltransferase family protein [Pyrinomonadaceae bacterium]|nr:biotin-dependent carboxyltransferase family protein [Phycisphaerales bacterium]